MLFSGRRSGQYCRDTLKFHFVENIDQVLKLALGEAPGKNGQLRRAEHKPR
jgi:hypothetical protein